VLDWLATLSGIITLTTAGPTVHSWLSGMRVRSDMDAIDQQVRILADRIYSMEQSSIRMNERHATKSDFVPEFARDPSLRRFTKVTDGIGKKNPKIGSLVADKPENFLDGIQRLDIGCAPPPLINNPTFVPFTFEQANQTFIGFAKRGFLEMAGMQVDFSNLNRFEYQSKDDAKAPKPEQDKKSKPEALVTYNPETGQVTSRCRACGRRYRVSVPFHSATYRCPAPCGERSRIKIRYSLKDGYSAQIS